MSAFVADKLILRGFVSGLVFLLLAKLGGAIKEVIVAHAYGTSTVVDAYAFGFAVANWPITLGTMCANMLLVPIFVQGMRASGMGELDVRALLSRLLPISAVVAAAIYVLLRFGTTMLGVSPTLEAAVEMQAAGLALMIPPGVAGAVLAARLMASRRQISALLEAIPALFVSVCILTFGMVLDAGALLGWATAIGFLLYFGALILADRNVLKASAPRPLRVDNFNQHFAILLLAQIFFSLGGVLDQLAAATLSQEQNAAVAYANRLLMLVTGLGVTAVGRAVMPVLSEAWGSNSEEGKRLQHRWLFILFAGGLAAALVAFPLVRIVVRMLFEHGNFAAGDTEAVSSLVRVGLLQLPFVFASLILAQGAVVERRFGLLLLANLLGFIAKLLLILVFLEGQGVVVLMYGTTAMYCISLLVLGGARLMFGSARL
jgi:putative peptidoglycan lipid II flippase